MFKRLINLSPQKICRLRCYLLGLMGTGVAIGWLISYSAERRISAVGYTSPLFARKSAGFVQEFQHSRALTQLGSAPGVSSRGASSGGLDSSLTESMGVPMGLRPWFGRGFNPLAGDAGCGIKMTLKFPNP